RLALEIVGNIQTACHQKIGSGAASLELSDLQCLSRSRLNDRPESGFGAVEIGLHRGAGQTKFAVGVESERRTRKSDFQSGCRLSVTEESVAETECQRIHRARGWN